ncbi:hypothetical protein [Francisella frigiditurris]|uniref:Uncharacterized protein n=1 Tax=Francisella frigiditurris TaxID=1542390 RepID=A0A1J0KS27_9GAMM|nr:hypothetical protein [Francisella frigiditurris]APC96428.1 hypothetical protein KX01_479 [Francisella frigiditurris]
MELINKKEWIKESVSLTRLDDDMVEVEGGVTPGAREDGTYELLSGS